MHTVERKILPKFRSTIKTIRLLTVSFWEKDVSDCKSPIQIPKWIRWTWIELDFEFYHRYWYMSKGFYILAMNANFLQFVNQDIVNVLVHLILGSSLLFKDFFFKQPTKKISLNSTEHISLHESFQNTLVELCKLCENAIVV